MAHQPLRLASHLPCTLGRKCLHQEICGTEPKRAYTQKAHGRTCGGGHSRQQAQETTLLELHVKVGVQCLARADRRQLHDADVDRPQRNDTVWVYDTQQCKGMV